MAPEFFIYNNGVLTEYNKCNMQKWQDRLQSYYTGEQNLKRNQPRRVFPRHDASEENITHKTDNVPEL